MTSEYSGAGDVTRSMALLWGKGERPSRGPKPSLTVERIAQAAIELADAEGITGLSMRHVATKLNVGTMSLYRYVPSKAELIDVMLDRVYGENLDQPDPDDGWRKGLERIARGQWAMYLRHNWLLQVSSGRPLLGPNSLKGFESSLRLLAGLGLTDVDRVNVIGLVSNYVSGTARTAIEAAMVAQQTGISDEQFWSAQGPILSEVLYGGDYPEVAALGGEIYGEVADTAFDFGLDRLLDGIELVIRRKACSDPTDAAR
ncbi:TetR/AcrR family transcriptional regulator [Actinocrispum wychmicini]|uniref:TetR family transcriptional regulator n=1 Tax=Actinocrispum wychmicini TaxID=1213861 RepID=A0A4R2J6A2_9PSEU|nr:TetR/AcrR family transcriptional regulator [Actinocrispum wychmicini]TCO53032.1 TetR family transcriptional regulator [Actinocrispum wychmicini]